MQCVGKSSRTILAILLIIALVMPAAVPTPVSAQTVRPTLRVYGHDPDPDDPTLTSRPFGPGDLDVLDPASDPTNPVQPEDPPYTQADPIFNPTEPQAPRTDSVTWNPAWMYENQTFDENQQLGLYQQIYADELNLAEKVWFRHWYEPEHEDVDSIVYPAVMEEFTYILTEAENLDYPRFYPEPAVGRAGRTQFVFPIGMRADEVENPAGRGLTSLDADFDCVPDIVQVHSEATLRDLTGATTDFNVNATIDTLDTIEATPIGPAVIPFNGNELVVFSLEPKTLSIGGRVQFLDHMIELAHVGDTGATLRIFYTGDLEPVNTAEITQAFGEVWTYGTRTPPVRLPAAPAPLPPGDIPGPFFAQVTNVDRDELKAQVRIGRALGQTHANVAAGEPNASLKRFYVDGHEYNVVAIGTNQIPPPPPGIPPRIPQEEGFRFITLRTPVPKADVIIPRHSVRLQSYAAEEWLSVLPPFNYEHYVIKDVQKEQTGALIGELHGPVAPIQQDEAELPYTGICPLPHPVEYADAQEMRFSYVREEPNPQFVGQMLELYRDGIKLQNCPTTAPVPLGSGDPLVHCSGTYTVIQEDVDSGRIFNTAIATSAQTGTVTDTVNVSVPDGTVMDVVFQMSLFDDADGSGTITVGDTIEYEVDIFNDGLTDLTNVAVTPVDPDLVLTGAIANTLAAGGFTSSPAEYAVEADDIVAGVIQHTVRAFSAETGFVVAQTETFVPNGESLTVDKWVTGFTDSDGSGDISVGDTLAFEIDVINSGLTPLTVAVADLAPETWQSLHWQTDPRFFTEFLLPDIQNLEDLYFVTPAFTAPEALEQGQPVPPDGVRVQFWFDPATSDAKYKTPDWVRIYGANSFGAGNANAADPLLPAAPVETFPYSGSEAPFNPLYTEAPIKDFLTFNPAIMSEFLSLDDPLRSEFYPRISIDAHDGMEKAWLRMWYEPDHLNKVLVGQAGGPNTDVYTFPALMQEYTYMFLDTDISPTIAPAGGGKFGLPVGTTWDELFDPFGYGLTTFDADFDAVNDDVVTIHSEVTLEALTGISADFDGDGVLDPLDTDAPLTGNELAVFAVGNITLTPEEPYAMFLDHMVELVDVMPFSAAELQIWNTGGGLERTPDGEFIIVPHEVDGSRIYRSGSMGITGRNKVNVTQLDPGGSSLGSLDGPWFVWVQGINTQTGAVTVTVGRALGATYSAIDDGNGNHDLTPGDPWYLKRFFVDGHEYNVVALYTPQMPDGTYGFKYITLRTPVPKVNFVNREDSQKLEGYPVGSTISVLPPFNFEHTVAADIVDNHDDIQPPIGEFILRPPLEITIEEEAIEEEFTGELKELLVATEDSVIRSDGVSMQLAFIIEGSAAAGPNWEPVLTSLAGAVRDSRCLPRNGTVELSVFGYSAGVPVPIVNPTVIDSFARADGAATNIEVAVGAALAGPNNLGVGLATANAVIAGSPNFDPALRQVVNVVQFSPIWPFGTTAAQRPPAVAAVAASPADEIDIETIGRFGPTLGGFPNFWPLDWLHGSIARPALGGQYPAPGWVVPLANTDGFAQSVCAKLRAQVDSGYVWDNHPFNTIPDQYTALGLPEGELYLLTSSWREIDDERVMFWFQPGQSEDLFVNQYVEEPAPPPVDPPPVDPPTDCDDPPAGEANSLLDDSVAVKEDKPVDPKSDEPPATEQAYIVQAGDTLAAIAARFGVDPEEMRIANNLPPNGLIYVGQALQIP